jgi:hypothetical protein
LRDALEFFDEVLRVNGKSKLENLEGKAIKYMDGWFGHDTQDVVTAKIARSRTVGTTNSLNKMLIGTVQ